MKISARNVLKGTVRNVTEGAVNGVVEICIGGGQHVIADITMGSIKRLGLAEGKEAYAVVKATNVMFATGDTKIDTLSARNQFAGIIKSVEEGAVNGHVVLELENGAEITGSITNSSIERLGLAKGVKALAVIKATDVMVAID